MAEPERHSDQPQPAPDGRRASRVRRPRWRPVANVALVALAVLGVLLVSVLILLQTEFGRARVESIALAELRALLAEDAELDVERLEGNFLRGATLLNAVVREGNEPALQLDTLHVQYNLWTLFRRTFSAKRVYASGVSVWARQAEDGSWNVGRILRPVEEPDTVATPWTIELNRIALRRGGVELQYFHPERDSILALWPLEFNLDDFVYDEEGVRTDVDSLAMILRAAVLDPAPVRLATAGAVHPDRAELRSLLIDSHRSEVRGAGAVFWEDTFTFDADLDATPLALADVRQFFDIPLYGTADVRLQAQGTAERVIARLHADFQGHGSLALSGSYGGRDGATHIVADASVTELDPGQLLNNPDWSGRINGVAEVDLAGPAFDRLSGDVDLQIRESQFGEQPIMRADLDGRFDYGSLDFTLGAAVPGARILASGVIAPFEDVIPYRVSGEINDLDLATLTRDPGQNVRVRHATYRIAGRGTDLNRLAAEGTIQAADLVVGDLQFTSARLAASLARGVMDFNTDLLLADGGGAISAIGSMQPGSDPLVYTVDAGTVQNLNLAAITGDQENASDITGTFALAGVGTDPETMRLDFQASIRNSVIAGRQIVRADASGALLAGLLNIDLDADLGAIGSLTALGTVRPFADPITYDLTGTVTNLDLAALMDDPTQSSDLSGTYAITGAGIDPQTLVAEFRLDLQPSRYREQQFLAGTVRGRLAAGELVAAVDATTPEGQIAFDITGRPFDELPGIGLTGATFAGVNLALLLDAPWLQTNLSGRIDANVSSFDLETMVASGQIIFDQSTINAAVLQGGTVAFDLDAGRATAIAALNFIEGEAALAFTGRPFDERPTYAVDARLDSLDVVALMGDRPGRSRVNMLLDVTGEGFDPETMTLTASASAWNSILPDALVDSLRAEARLADGLLQVDHFRLAADFADAEARGQIALFDTTAATDLFVDATVRDAGPLNAFLDEQLFLDSATIAGHATGPAGGPVAVNATVIARQLTYGEYGTSRLDARVSAEYVPAAEVPVRGRARIRFDFISLPTFNVRDGDITVAYLDDDFVAEGTLSIDDARDLYFATRFETIDDPASGFHTGVRIDTLTIRVDQDRWQLLQPANLSIGDGRYRIRNFLLFAEDQQIAADGTIDMEGPLTLIVTTENVQVEPFTDLFNYEGVGGILTATLALSGTAAAPEVDGTIAITEITSGTEPVGQLAATLDFEDQRLAVDALLTHVTGQTFRADGFLPLAFRLDGVEADPDPNAPVQLHLFSEAFPISWAEPFLPPRVVTDIGGTLSTDVTITGTEGQPELQGQALINDGLLALEATGDVTFRDISIAMDLAGNTARLTHARVGDGRGGALTAEGTITLPQLSVGELDLRLMMNQFRAIDTPTYRALTLNASRGQNLRFTGTLTQPVLTGNVTLLTGDIYLTEELIGPDLEPVDLTPAQIQRVEETFGIRVIAADTAQAAFVDNLRLDLGVTIERNVWLRSRQNPRFDIEFAGTINVEKPPGGENQLFGSIEVIRGRIELPTLAGRAFTIGTLDNTYGQLTFNGPVDETLVDLRAGLEARAGLGTGTSAIVYVGLTGRLAESPELELSADPAMETADIACVIATGRVCGEAFQGGAVEEIALGQLGAMVQGIAGQQLGLDVVEIVQRPTGEIVVTFGAYVGDRTFAAVSQPIREPQGNVDRENALLPEVLIEYELLRWLMVRLERRNIGGVGGSLLFQFEY